MTQSQPRRILVLSSTFPSCAAPEDGVFVKERVKAIAGLPDHEVRVLAPVPYFPPIRQFPRWYPWSQYPRAEVVDGLSVSRPRYLLPPKLGGYFHPRLMWRAARREAERIRADFDFDLIDAHWSYPNGVVGALLGRLYGKPVVITGRGEDMSRFPDLPFVGRRIRWAIRSGAQLIALSREIARAMEQNGGPRDSITVIPNGVDCDKFQPVDQQQARRELGLPADAKIIVSVGARMELKGFHLLVDALPLIRRQHGDARAVIVGGPGRFGRDYTEEIERRVQAHNLREFVVLAGARPHNELKSWYGAADLFALLSSREGSPNVLMEALSCGVPAAATSVGGVPDLLDDRRLGVLITERTVEAIAAGINRALAHDWHHTVIRKKMESHSWTRTAESVSAVFERAISNAAAGRLPLEREPQAVGTASAKSGVAAGMGRFG